MNNPINVYKNTEKSEPNKWFSKSNVFIKEDDQDWGSSGMNDIKSENE